ncbi:MAG TPA: guanylate kinase [Candidatus Coprenecus stercoravium]|uniref:Guanylate kinase n=1 Tax=Candidatus Coprenecus stercoravium TaxID=2840735 RepID=A0A9D2GSB5_9BACT|nr:guanylate kinase [Candidatus Coprenecus stercoravium]
MNKKVIIFSAPSGAGKSTVVGHLLKKYPFLEFSISATSRAPRGSERDGVEYYFFSPEQFRDLISRDAFIEYEEVYPGSFYGTLRSEIERIWAKGHVILFDIDVKGGVNLKRIFGDSAMSVFVMPPSIDELRKRLEGRGTDSPEAIEKRVAKAAEELQYKSRFDRILVNDDLDKALAEADKLIEDFTGAERYPSAE